DNDGRPEPVVKHRLGECTEEYGPPRLTQTLIVLAADRVRIDPAKTDHVMQNPFKESIRPHGSVFGQGYGVFSYHGETYFDRWDSDVVAERGTFLIYKTANKITTLICKYRHVEPSKEK